MLRPKKIDRLMEMVRKCLDSGRYRDTCHSIERRLERKIILPEVVHVLRVGRHEKSKDIFDEVFDAWNYAVRGKTLEGMDLRVIISFDEANLLIITAFFIEKKGGR